MEPSGKEKQICNDEDILKLLSHFVKTNHRVKNADIKGETIMELCSLLFSRDYKFTIVPNLSGELCSHYPMKLIITEFERAGHDTETDEHFEARHRQHEIFQMMKIARCARCRSRFVVPVIFFEGKHICRSATLSGAAEMFGRSTTDYFMSNQNSSTFAQGNSDLGRPDMFDKFRGYDIQLLKYFDVGFICDLMVEKKKTKFGLPVTSSEKVDKENRYSDFSILGMPYPGCEFFKEWKENFYCGESTVYDWGQALNDSSLDLPDTPFCNELAIDWNKYKEWNITKLTQNYMKLLLKHIKEASTGLLVHCISGWDRTPLFVSLLRLSLWADGLIHTSLNPTEMLYLTLGYDWYLFGHDLPDRLSNDEEVLFFCFKVLKDIASDSFSLNTSPQLNNTAVIHSSPPSKGSSPLVQQQPQQQQQPQSSSPLAQQQQQQQQMLQQQHQQHHQHPQLLQNQIRVDSDSSLGIQGVLLADDLMTFSGKGSNGSLNSLGSSDGPAEPCHFLVGDIQEEEEGEEEGQGGGEGRRDGARIRSTRTSIPARHSMSPSLSSPHSNTASPILRHSSPINTANPGAVRHHSSSPTPINPNPAISSNTNTATSINRRGSSNWRRSSADSLGQSQQALSIQSNHFMNSPLGRASSPMSVPGKGGPHSSSLSSTEDAANNPPPSASSLSVGSWQIIPSVDNLRGMDSTHSNSNSSSNNDRASHVSSCPETYDINTNTVRWQQLDAVSRLFESAYIRAVPSAHVRTSSVGAGLTSLFDRFAEQVGFRGGGGGGGSNQNITSRRGV